MSITVQFLGTGSAMPKLNAHPSCQFIFCENRRFIVDCGEGAQIQMRKYKVGFQKINAVFISHLHGDHFFGLVGLLSSMHLLGRVHPIAIYGPPELEQIVRMQLEVGHAKLKFKLCFHVIEDGQTGTIYEDNVLEVHTFPLKHKIQTNGFVFREKPKPRPLNAEAFRESGLSIRHISDLKAGKDVVDDLGRTHDFRQFTFEPSPPSSYAYCSDTTYSEKVVDAISGVHTVYHEATFIDKDKERAKATKHATATQAAKVALKAGAQRLYIGHLSARYDDEQMHLKESRSVFPESFYAKEGLTIQV